eukprot:14757756-Ditylum_brightwellii.AAC.1
MHEAATPIRCQEVIKLHHEAKIYTKKLEDMLSDSDMAFFNEGITSREIPEPQFLIKDNKK